MLTDDGPLRVSLGSELLDRIAHDPTAAPCAGDWGTLCRWPDGPVTLHRLLPRGASIVRVEPGGSTRGQVLAANIDLVAVVIGLLPEPSMRRVERLLALGWASGARPVVVLTKADLVGDADHIAADVTAVASDVPVLVVSATTGAGVPELRELIGAGTAGLIGGSGAGKSSLVNAMVGTDVLRTREIRADGRGRHTSVRRELVPLPGGGAVIDTPGLRGVGLRDAAAGVAAAFADIEELVAGCRFRDCSHRSEPGCAVLAALADGRLAQRRLESWRKLRAETVALDSRRDRRHS